MIKHTFLDKSCTIVKGLKNNLGLNPVAELNYGKVTSRALIHFDEKELVDLYMDKSLGDLSKVHHILHLTNCMNQDSVPYEKTLDNGLGGEKERACSFDVIIFKLPKDFDGGRGFDFSSDAFIKNNRSVSKQACTWYNSTTNSKWDEPGVYSIDTLLSSAATDIIIARQHFDFGNENFEFDITDWVNNIIKTEAGDDFYGGLINHGLGIAFAPEYEMMGEKHYSQEKEKVALYEYPECGEPIITGYTILTRDKIAEGIDTQEYVGFFTDHTNTIFHPYLETIYEDYINDDRAQFYIGKANRLYFYSVIDGEYTNLDNVPACEIDGTSFPVIQAGKGVYYAEIKPSAIEMEPNSIYYDTWSKLAVNGQEMDNVELEFVALPGGKYFQLGAGYPMKDNLVPSLSGIDDMEKLPFNERRRVIVDFRKKYSTDKKDLISSAEYRIYVKDGDREITIFDYSPVEKTFMSNFFYVNTNDFVPAEYHVDIRVKNNEEVRQYKDKLRFIITDDITNFYA